jgi:hypothetical protein
MRRVWIELCAVLRIRPGFEVYDADGNILGLSIPDVCVRDVSCLDLKLSTLRKIRDSSTRPRVAEYAYENRTLQVTYLEGCVTLRLV